MDIQNLEEHRTGFEIAVIGMLGKFPGAGDIGEFWENLKNGMESISFFSEEELINAGVNPELVKDPNYIKAYGALVEEEIYCFDSHFFDYYPREAEVLDPQLRIFHESCWKALEEAGYDCESYSGLIGLYAGASANFPWETISYTYNNTSPLDGFSMFLLADKDFLCTRVAYKLNLKGPAVTVQSACSTSLLAIHQACRGLLMGECDMALAGGITIRIPQKNGYLHKKEMILSADGHCRAFATEAGGTIGGSGVGIVVLKRLDRAVADGDYIYALIKGSGVNNDGKRKIGFTAPSVEGQAEAIRTAHQMAEIPPESIGYVEAHGTGTPLGDPVEIEALKMAFNTDKRRFCAIGSVKTNVGHLDSAAGVASFIKTVLALKNKQIPPSLFFITPNPKIEFENSPFYVNNRLKEWKNDMFPLRAGVSSFGIGGTNVHIVLEEWWADSEAMEPCPMGDISAVHPQLLLLSAKTETSLERMKNNLGNHLKKNPGINLPDVAYTLQVGRRPFKYRGMLLCSSPDEAIETLLTPESEAFHSYLCEEKNRPVVFLFPGQGSQYVNMGLELYEREPVFREEIDRCFKILNFYMGYDLKEILYPASDASDSPEQLADKINQTENTQPIIFAVEYALAKLIMKWGIKPYAMLGHSIGEYTAACLAGVFSLEDALKIVALRGRLMQKVPHGAMLSVSLPGSELGSFLRDDIALAAVNGPSLSVLSGPYEAIRSVEIELKAKGCKTRLLNTSHAFHSSMMDPILNEFEEQMGGIGFNKPMIPYISNLTGKWITVEDSRDPHYWVKHLRKTVHFAQGLEVLFKEPQAIFIEVGPGSTLSTFARQYRDIYPGHPIMNLLRHPKENISDIRYLLEKIGQLWLYGSDIDGEGFFGEEKRRRLPLPSYSFEPTRYPIDLNSFKPIAREGLNKYSIQKEPDISNWFYIPLWEKSFLNVKKPVRLDKSYNWLVFLHEQEPLGTLLLNRLEREGQNVIIVRGGPGYRETAGKEYTIDPRSKTHYDSLFDALHHSNNVPDNILHLWGVSEKERRDSWKESVEEDQELGLYSLLYIAQAIGQVAISNKIKLTVVTNNMQEVTGDDGKSPVKATVLGAIKVISLEYPNIDCKSIDIDLFSLEPGSKSQARVIDLLLAESMVESHDRVIALRGNYRWVQIFKPFPLETGENVGQRLREKGVYLITGGLGGIGFTLAGDLATRLKARLILTGRSPFPTREEWEEILNRPGDEDHVKRIIMKIREWEEMGAEVMVVSADVANLEEMRTAVARAEERFGPVNGVIHTAGVPDGALIQRRTPDITVRVLAAKIKGTMVLDYIFKETGLDFLVLCSSLSSIITPLGQVAYGAANVFLDSFAWYNTFNSNIFTVAINWDTWREVGMAVQAAEGFGKRTVKYPLFQQCIILDTVEIYISYFSVKKTWLLDEHRIFSRGTLPGTAYLEIARAAFENNNNSSDTIEINHLYFLQPLVVEEEEEREVRTILKRSSGSCEFFIMSQSRQQAGQWLQHATGKITSIKEKRIQQYNLNEIREKFAGQPTSIKNSYNWRADLLKFGPRWGSHRELQPGADEALITLKFPDAFAAELETYRLHPALLDTSIIGIFEEGSYYLPFSYQRVRINGPLPPGLISYIRLTEDKNSPKEFKHFRITLMDEEGFERVEIEKYTLMIVPEERTRNRQLAGNPVPDSSASASLSDLAPYLKDLHQLSAGNRGDISLLKYGILPDEGINVFHRALGGILPQVVVSTLNLEYRLNQYKTITAADYAQSQDDKLQPKTRVARPELSTKYVKPVSDIENKIAAIFQQFLGIEKIGVNDNFFELGANSLMLVQLNLQLEKELGKTVSVTAIYAHPSIKTLSGFLIKGTTEMGGVTEHESQQLKIKVEKGKDKLVQRKNLRKGVRNEL